MENILTTVLSEAIKELICGSVRRGNRGGRVGGGNRGRGCDRGGRGNGSSDGGRGTVVRNRAGGNRADGNRAGGHRAGGNRTGGNRTGGNRTGGNRAGGNYAGGNRARGGRFGNRGGGGRGNGDRSDGPADGNVQLAHMTRYYEIKAKVMVLQKTNKCFNGILKNLHRQYKKVQCHQIELEDFNDYLNNVCVEIENAEAMKNNSGKDDRLINF